MKKSSDLNVCTFYYFQKLILLPISAYHLKGKENCSEMLQIRTIHRYLKHKVVWKGTLISKGKERSCPNFNWKIYSRKQFPTPPTKKKQLPLHEETKL